MDIIAELSYHPFEERSAASDEVNAFLNRLDRIDTKEMEVGPMSTRITADYSELMPALQREMEHIFEEQDAVFEMKISNARN